MKGSISKLHRFALGSFPLFWQLLAIGSLVWSQACGTPSITVPQGPHRRDQEEAPVQVSRPPPSAKIEVVPLRRNSDCFYLDGHYKPIGDTWAWEKGKWVIIPNNCYYAPPVTQYETIEGGTTLVHRPGVWLPESTKGQKCGAPLACPPMDRKLD